MSSSFSPRAVDLRVLAREAATLTRTDRLTDYPRLAEEASGDLAGLTLHWTATGEMLPGASGEAEVWLHLAVEAVLPMTCQRCLASLDAALQVDQSFRFVADEATAAAQDDASEEDVLVLAPEFDLPALVEDELLMALPIVPRHERCTAARSAKAVQDVALAPDGLPEKPNPFAVLAGLRTGKGEKSN